MFSLQSVSLFRGSRCLFEDASFTANPGDKIGLTGANGCGKSSLLLLLMAKLTADEGEVQIPGKPEIAWAEQETIASEDSAINFVLDGDKPLRHWQHKLNVAECDNNANQIALATEQLDNIDAWSATNRAGKLLAGLGFSEIQQQNSVSSFSGGWRMRLNLARALMSPSDILLLDEPTNHLDLDAIIWLERWLSRYQGTLVLISHDRDFLDNVVGKIVHIENRALSSWTGNYSAFEKLKAEKLILEQKSNERIAREKKRLQGFVDRFRAKASKAKQVQSRVKAMERLGNASIIHSQSVYRFHFEEPESSPRPILRLEEVAIGYNNKPWLTEVNLTIHAGDRLGLLGQNGAGKSTLLKHLAGKLAILDGESWFSPNTRIGFFAQHQLEQLQLSQTPAEILMNQFPILSNQDAQNYLGRFGFQGDRINENIENFSGGEKARLVLALIIKTKPNLLILDEPTNHLDLDMRESLTLALQEYSGALILVSHDRHLLKATTDHYLLVANHHVSDFDGDVEDYRKWIQQEGRAQKTKSDLTSKSTESRKQQRQKEAARRQQLAPLKNKLKSLESKIESHQKILEELETKLADNSLYQAENKDQLKKIITQQSAIKSVIEDIEMQWLDITEQMESL